MVKRITDFACDTIVPFPHSFPTYAFPTAPHRALRRAVLDRRYAVVYEVRDAELVFVYVYSTFRRLETLALPTAE